MAEIRRSPVEVTVACLIIFSVLHIAGGSLGFLPVGWPVLHPVFAASFSSWIHLFFRTDTFSEGVVGCCDESSLISSFRGKTDSSIKRYMEERLNRKDGILKVKKKQTFLYSTPCVHMFRIKKNSKHIGYNIPGRRNRHIMKQTRRFKKPLLLSYSMFSLPNRYENTNTHTKKNINGKGVTSSEGHTRPCCCLFFVF